MLPIFANGAVTAAFSAVVSEGVGSIAKNQNVDNRYEKADLTSEQEKEILNELSTIEKAFGDANLGTQDDVAETLHDITGELRSKYKIEFGARIVRIGKGYGFRGLTTQFRKGSVVIGTLERDTADWHNHPKGLSRHSDNDIDAANLYNIDSYVSSSENIEKYNRTAMLRKELKGRPLKAFFDTKLHDSIEQNNRSSLIDGSSEFLSHICCGE